MKDYKLDTKLLPQVWVIWNTQRDGRNYLNCKTGKKKHTPELWMLAEYGHLLIRNNRELNGKMWVEANSNCQYLYAKYHKDIDRLELAVVKMNTCRKEDPRNWEFTGERYFLGKDKTIQCLNRKETTCYRPHSNAWAWSDKDLLSSLLRVSYNDNVISEFKKFIGDNYFTIGNGTTIAIQYAWHIQKWYETVRATKTTGKQQKLVDKLIAMPLSDTTGLARKYLPKEINSWCIVSNFMYFERIDDEWCVLRAFKPTIHNEVVELWRVYLNDKTVRIASPTQNGWVPSRQPHNWWNARQYLANPEEAAEKCNRLKYILEAISYEKEENIADVLVKVLRFPELEQLIKLGCVNTVKNASHSYTPKADLKYAFGGYYNDKETSVLRKIGLTKKQLDVVLKKNDNYYTFSGALRKMRQLFGNDLSYMDIESFEKYYTMSYELDRRWYVGDYVRQLHLDEIKFYKNLARLGEKNSDVYGVASDLMSDYRRLNHGTQPMVDWYFDSYSDVVRLHDAVGELRRQQDAERRAMWDMSEAERLKKQEEKRKKIDEDRQKYNYAEDDFIIRLPKDLNEIVSEGNKQRICIGSYTGRHAEGNTNIFFLRKALEPDTPFYAIEMKNDIIIQIHGCCNKWLGNNPEAIPTVIRWLRKHGIKCDDKILTCKSTGYCAKNDYVPMPQVD